ncbi:MAG: hypothetical protein H5T69_00870 [Chloroflexi bacterium]|nr:hypothetical protein [Chloroflexota bacterium]
MSSSAAKGIFFINLSILGAVIVLAVYQVPQPWRGYLVAWLLFMATVGAFVLRIICHHYAYKSLELQERGERLAVQPKGVRAKEDLRARSAKLRVVRRETAGAGRHIVR